MIVCNKIRSALTAHETFLDNLADPHHLDLYEKYNKFLRVINVPTNSSYKDNFVKIDKLVLIGGPDDGVITPWQSRYVISN